jgi:DNA-binding transcriptional ArsR family regulator
MSVSRRKDLVAQRRACASVFSALGDETRLELVGKLSGGHRRSISQLAEGSKLTRQAVTKHLRVLEGAGVVRGVKEGRETLFEFESQAVGDVARYLDQVSARWDVALARLKGWVEG